MSSMKIKEISKNKCFGGHLIKYEHASSELHCNMRFNVFLPKESASAKVPAIIFLSGLSCTEDNFMQKSGALAEAAKHGLAIIACDTSPRGVSIDGDSDRWDFGQSAGFYVDATEDKWKKHYRMYSYVVEELYNLVTDKLAIDKSRISIMGHSMGGHGALVIHLKNADKFKTASAFAPIAHPVKCQWGKKAFKGYLGSDTEAWEEYDTVELLEKGKSTETSVLIDVGTADEFLAEQLDITALQKVVEEKQLQSKWNIRSQEGYDHSYYFISTFIADHIEHHAKALSA